MTIDPLKLAKTSADLQAARAEAALKLEALRQAEQVVRDRRADFARAKTVVNRMNRRHTRLKSSRN